jgi:hypothetical protein
VIIPVQAPEHFGAAAFFIEAVFCANKELDKTLKINSDMNNFLVNLTALITKFLLQKVLLYCKARYHRKKYQEPPKESVPVLTVGLLTRPTGFLL